MEEMEIYKFHSPDGLFEESKIKAVILTKNGIHLITKPFNSQTFSAKYPEVQIHKDNPTLLFIP